MTLKETVDEKHKAKNGRNERRNRRKQKCEKKREQTMTEIKNKVSQYSGCVLSGLVLLMVVVGILLSFIPCKSGYRIVQ